MPTYEYRCPDGHVFERRAKMSEAASELVCPECGKIATRQLSGGAGLVFKGSGFYLTDYGKNAHRGGPPETVASKSGESGDGKSADAKPAESKSGDSKSGDSKAGDSKSSDSKSGDKKSTDAKPTESRTTESKSGDKSGGGSAASPGSSSKKSDQ
jgi:putative FmdB family regulatory protein